MLSEEDLGRLKEFGYRIHESGEELAINRRIAVPLFVWLLVAAFGLVLIIYPLDQYILLAGIVFLFTPIILYRRNIASEIVFNKLQETISFKKGVFRTQETRNYVDVKELRFRTYDVMSSATPFAKGAREYMADIRIYWKKGDSIEVFYFERRVRAEVSISQIAFKELVEFTGLNNSVTDSN